MWIFPWIKLSWYSCSMWDKLGWLNWLWQFLCEGLPSFNPKRFCYPYAWSCSLCEKRNSFCMGLISRKLCGFLCFWPALLHSVSYSFFLYQSPSLPLCTVYSISSIMDEVLKLTDLLMCLSLKTLKDWFCKNALSDIRFLLKNMKSTYFDYLKNISQFFWMFSIVYRKTFFLNWFNIHDVTTAPHLFRSIFKKQELEKREERIEKYFEKKWFYKKIIVRTT